MSEWKPQVEGKGEFIAATWAEDFNCFYRFESLEYARGFVAGYGRGASNYGAGNCWAILLDADGIKELEDAFNAKALAEVVKYTIACGLKVPGL